MLHSLDLLLKAPLKSFFTYSKQPDSEKREKLPEAYKNSLSAVSAPLRALHEERDAIESLATRRHPTKQHLTITTSNLSEEASYHPRC